jgi:hypothetical protein
MSAASFACCRRVSVPRQGASNAAVAAGVVWLYFDLGGAVNGNLGTFPPELRRFCFSTHPPVVLSHWDWDHWSSASRGGRDVESTGVPRANVLTVLRAPNRGGSLGRVAQAVCRLADVEANGRSSTVSNRWRVPSSLGYQTAESGSFTRVSPRSERRCAERSERCHSRLRVNPKMAVARRPVEVSVDNVLGCGHCESEGERRPRG